MSPPDRFAISEGVAVLVAAFLTLGVVAAMFFTLRPRAVEESAAVTAAMATLEGERDRLQGDLERLNARVVEMEAAVSAARGEAEADRKRLEASESRRLDEKAQLELAMDELTRDRDTEMEKSGRLRKELNDAIEGKMALAERVQVLSDAAKAAMPAVPDEADAVVDEPPPVRMTTDVALRVLHDVRVVEVNRPLAYVVLDVGANHGVKAGMVFSVMEENQVIAKATTIDVRPDMSGAAVDQVVVRFPSPNDRAILRRGSN